MKKLSDTTFIIIIIAIMSAFICWAAMGHYDDTISIKHPRMQEIVVPLPVGGIIIPIHVHEVVIPQPIPSYPPSYPVPFLPPIISPKEKG